jgi:hypothetical protein
VAFIAIAVASCVVKSATILPSLVDIFGYVPAYGEVYHV